jgi:hypothetical protein
VLAKLEIRRDDRDALDVGHRFEMSGHYPSNLDCAQIGAADHRVAFFAGEALGCGESTEGYAVRSTDCASAPDPLRRIPS